MRYIRELQVRKESSRGHPWGGLEGTYGSTIAMPTTPLAAELLSTLLTHAVRVRRALQLSGNLGLNRILLRGANAYREVGE